MVEFSSQQGAVLVFLSVAALTLTSAICLWCRKKSKIVQEDNQLYDQNILHREGSRFAVTRSKTVTRPNQINPNPFHNTGDCIGRSNAQLDVSQDSQMALGYANLPEAIFGSLEPTYVDPIPSPPKKNLLEDSPDDDTDGADYINVYRTQDINHDSDSQDYVNVSGGSEDEPDYVNTSDTPNKGN